MSNLISAKIIREQAEGSGCLFDTLTAAKAHARRTAAGRAVIARLFQLAEPHFETRWDVGVQPAKQSASLAGWNST